MAGKRIETVEGMMHGNELHPLQAALADLGAAQCGYCTPGILMTAKALIAENPKPGTAEINEALAGNLCRCTGYQKIVEGVEWAAARMRGEDGTPQRRSSTARPSPFRSRSSWLTHSVNLIPSPSRSASRTSSASRSAAWMAAPRCPAPR